MAAPAHGTSAPVLLPLTPADIGGTVPLETAMMRRRSRRRFTGDPITEFELAQLLWAAQGVTGADQYGPVRTAPSAGRTDPLEVYVVTGGGVMHYLALEHAVESTASGDRRSDLATAAGEQDCVRNAAAVFVIVAEVARTAAAYGDRAGRFVALEAGHAAQNLLLQATVLGLDAVPVGSFDDAPVAGILGLPGGWDPVYLIPVGHRAPR